MQNVLRFSFNYSSSGLKQKRLAAATSLSRAPRTSTPSTSSATMAPAATWGVLPYTPLQATARMMPRKMMACVSGNQPRNRIITQNSFERIDFKWIKNSFQMNQFGFFRNFEIHKQFGIQYWIKCFLSLLSDDECKYCEWCCGVMSHVDKLQIRRWWISFSRFWITCCRQPARLCLP